MCGMIESFSEQAHYHIKKEALKLQLWEPPERLYSKHFDIIVGDDLVGASGNARD